MGRGNNGSSKNSKTIFEILSFTQIKKDIDKGYEYFWSKPHRKHLKPECANFGFIDVTKREKDYTDTYDNIDF